MSAPADPASKSVSLWKRCRKFGAPIVAGIGILANGIQIATTGMPSIAGMVIFGLVIAGCALTMAYQYGRYRGRRKRDGEFAVLTAARDELLRELSDSGVALEATRKELRESQGVLEATLDAHQPYNDERTIVFDIGERPEDDRVQDWHTTTPDPDQAPVVYWCQFEAFSRGPAQALSWDDVELDVTRQPEGQSDPQHAGCIRLESKTTPRALIAFAPPRPTVKWVAKYRSPGLWDPLREDVQNFEWDLPMVSPDDTSGRRSPLRAVTLIFRVPRSLGALEVTGPGSDVHRSVETNGAAYAPSRNYKFEIRDVVHVLGPRDSPARPINWFLRLRAGSPTS